MESLFAEVRKLIIDVLGIVLSPARTMALLKEPLYANAIYLMLANIVNALFGFVFWILVTRFYTAADVGLASAVLSSAGLLSTLCGLGLGYGILRFLPLSRSPHKLLNTVFTVSGLLALIIAVIFVLGLSVWSPSLVFIREHPVYLAIFVLYVPVAALAGLIDQSFMAHRRAGFVLGRSIIFNVLRLLLPVLLAACFGFGSFGIFGAVALATGVAMSAAILFLLPRASPGYRPQPVLSGDIIKETVPYSFVNYLGDLFWLMPGFILPLLIVNRLGAAANAYFAIAWTMSGILTMIPAAVATSLLAEGSRDEAGLRHYDARRGLKMTFLLLVPAVILLWVLADKFLLLCGAAYAQNGATLLRWLALAALPMAVNILFFSVKRVQRQLKPIILMSATMAAVTLVLTFILLPRMGIDGVGIAWLAGQSAMAVVAIASINK
jgi:O-antigen/teichoic acid export membrane protein